MTCTPYNPAGVVSLFRYPAHVIPTHLLRKVGYHAFPPPPPPRGSSNFLPILFSLLFLSFTFFPQFYFEYFVRRIFCHSLQLSFFFCIGLFPLPFFDDFFATYKGGFFFFVKRIKRFECSKKFYHRPTFQRVFRRLAYRIEVDGRGEIEGKFFDLAALSNLFFTNKTRKVKREAFIFYLI